MTPVSIPSPPLEWEVLLELGAFRLHAYAVAILVGIFVALWLTRRRWVARGGDSEAMEEIAVWAIPFGIIGGRIYHVVSTPGPYFGEGGSPIDAFKIWDGGLGIWGAVAIGSLGAYIGARRAKVSFTAFMDAVAPGVLIAQAIGRLGNYFNHELFGAPTTMPWGLEIDATRIPSEYAAGTLFQPTFLYEMLWNLAGAALLIYLDRRFRFRFGRMFWLYVVVYTSGRLWIEMLRIDDAVLIGGVRINVWVAIATLLLGIGMFVGLGRRHRGQKDEYPARSFAPVPASTKHGTSVKASAAKSRAAAKQGTSVKASTATSTTAPSQGVSVKASAAKSRAAARQGAAVKASGAKSKATATRATSTKATSTKATAPKAATQPTATKATATKAATTKVPPPTSDASS